MTDNSTAGSGTNGEPPGWYADPWGRRRPTLVERPRAERPDPRRSGRAATYRRLVRRSGRRENRTLVGWAQADRSHTACLGGRACARRSQSRPRKQQQRRHPPTERARDSSVRSCSDSWLWLHGALSGEYGVSTGRVGSGSRLTFHAGEPRLSEWMDKHTRVAWCTHPQPWTVEPTVIRNLDLPLTLQGNAHHAFSTKLASIRAQARRQARELDIIP
jgi:hypothetical protein